MPAKVLPDQASFDAFARRMHTRGFRKLTRREFVSDFGRLGLEAPRPREGRETGFVFSANGLTVAVWTTFVEASGEARAQDAGWVLIKEGDQARYFAHPVHRTGNFFKKLLLRAAIARERVLNRPTCPSCGAYMHIARGDVVKSRFWICSETIRHPGGQSEFLPWDTGLRPIVTQYVKALRAERARQRKRQTAQGKQPKPAVLRRQPWEVTKPQNRV